MSWWNPWGAQKKLWGQFKGTAKRTRVGLSEPGGYLPQWLQPGKSYIRGIDWTKGYVPTAKAMEPYRPSGGGGAWGQGQPAGGGQPAGAPTSGGGGYGAAAEPEEPEPFEAWFQGTKYDDPELFRTAVSGKLLEDYNTKKANLDRMYDAGLIDFGERERGLKETRDKVIQGQKGYFSAISPQAIQSQQGTYAGEVRDVYQRGESQRKREKSDFEANTLDAISGLETDYMNRRDALQNALLSYSGQEGPYFGGYNAPEYSKDMPSATLTGFQNLDLTKQLYGKAVPTKPKYSAKKKAPVPPEEYLYT